MRKLDRDVVVCGILIGLLSGCCTSVAQQPNAEEFATVIDAPLPTPPAQGLPWTPPADEILDISFVQQMFAWGMADPRGLPYHEVTIARQGNWIPVLTRGWVLPPEPHTTQRFAIDWNGIIRPVAHIGEAADAEADVKRLLGILRVDAPIDPALPSIELDHCSFAMLSRLGHTELARELLSRQKIKEDFDIPRAVYIHREWSTRLIEAAERAHHGSLDRMALGYLIRFGVTADELQSAVAEEWGEPLEPHTHYFPRLNQLAALRADQLRRHARGLRSQVPAIWPGDQQACIAALIDHPDDAIGDHQNNPGGLSFRFDDLVTELVAEGEAAVPQLLDVLEHDKRLCRGLLPARLGDIPRTVSVRSPAYAALTRILEWGDWPEEPEEYVAAMREHWSRYSALPKHLRWYLILTDDQAGESAWRAAASRMVSQLEYRRAGLHPLPGEPLRGLREPSVSELLKRRGMLDELEKWERDPPGNFIPAFATPRLDRPATEADVREGRAVFHLTGERRVFDLPPHRVTAHLKGDWDVWAEVVQAEEQSQVDGTWKRYYGMASGSPKMPRRMAAEDIEFNMRGLSGSLPDGLTLSLSLSPEGRGVRFERQLVPMTHPLEVGIRLAVHSGTDRQAPERVIVYEDDGSVRTAGVTIHLQYADRWERPSKYQWGTLGLFRIGPGEMFNGEAVWRDVPRRIAAFAPLNPARTPLAAGHMRRVGELDLHQSFVIDRPGVYRLWASSDANGPLGAGETTHLVFCLRPNGPGDVRD